VYGDDAAKTFLDGKGMWRDHIKFFVAYTTALAKKDQAGQTKAVNDLKGYIEAFSGFLADATDLPQAALRTSITDHVNQFEGTDRRVRGRRQREGVPAASRGHLAHVDDRGHARRGDREAEPRIRSPRDLTGGPGAPGPPATSG
jgi:hypothetical protein